MASVYRWLVIASVAAMLMTSIEGQSARNPEATTSALQGSPFGVFYGLTPSKGRPTTQYLRELGVHWTRQTLDWQTVQPGRGRFQWGLVDGTVKLIDASKQAGFPLNVLVTIRARAPWASPGGLRARAGQATLPPVNLNDYYQFVNAVVRRVHGRVRYWQIENEVEYDIFWKGTPEQYLDLLRTGYRAVKDADPAAQVVLAGIGDVAWLTPMVRDEVTAGYGEAALSQYYEWAKANNSPAAKSRPASPQQLLAQVKRFDKMTGFTHQLLRSDAARYYDIIDLHAYHPYTLIPAGARWLRAVMANQGYSKPIWITETSGPNYPELWPTDQVGERRQAEELVKRYVLAIGSGVERIFWYVLQTPPHQAQGKWSHTGLLRPNGSRRPAYGALGLLARTLDGAREVNRLEAAKGVQAFELVCPGGSVYVLWADQGAAYQLPAGVARAEVTDALGQRTVKQGAGGVELRLTSLPVFVKPLAAVGAAPEGARPTAGGAGA